MPQPTVPPWIETLKQRDPEFVASYMSQREKILADGAIPAKYKHLMTMVVDEVVIDRLIGLSNGALRLLPSWK